MVRKENIDYELEMMDNIDIDSLRKQYSHGITLWLCGSGASTSNDYGSYWCVMEYNGQLSYYEKSIQGSSVQKALIMGAIEALRCVSDSTRVFIVTATTMGFTGYFKGKGTNVELMGELLDLVKEKNCQLTEVRYNSAEKIRKFIRECQPNDCKIVEKKANDWKQPIYEDCLNKIVNVLEKHKVDRSIIDEVKNLKPWMS